MKSKKPKSTFQFSNKAEALKAQRMLACATNDDWQLSGYNGNWQVTQMIQVTNLMSGKPIKIAADTPMCCDPSSETYWSM